MSSDAQSSGPQPLTRLETVRGMRLWNLSSGFSGVSGAILVGSYLTAFALHLGATNFQIGLLAAAGSWGQLFQFISPLLTEHRERRKPFCVKAYLVYYSLYAPLAIIPAVVPPELRAWSLIILMAVAGIATSLASPATVSWLTDLVPDELRGRFVARNQTIAAGSAMVASFLAGRYLDLFRHLGHETLGFVTVFLMGVLVGLFAIVIWMFCPEPPHRPSKESSSWAMLRKPFEHRQFRDLMVFLASRTLAVMIAAPFFTVFMLEELGISYSMIAILWMVMTVSQMSTNAFWGYLADKFGHRPLLRISTFGVSLIPLLWFFVTKNNYLYYLPIVLLYGGVVGAGILTSQFNMMVKLAPEENRSVYIGACHAVISVAVVIGSTFGGWLADWFTLQEPLTWLTRELHPTQAVFIVSCLFRLMSLGLITRVKEAEAAAAMTVMKKVASGNPLATTVNLRRVLRSDDPSTRVRAIRSLAAARSSLAVDELVAELADSDRAVRREAARALGAIGDPAAIGPLLAVTANHDDLPLVIEAIDALGVLGATEALPTLRQLAVAGDPAVRQAAIEALGVLGDPDMIAFLEGILADERDHAMATAITLALAQLGHAPSTRRLRDLLRSSPPGVQRKETARAIGELICVPTETYALLESPTLDQEERVAKLFGRAQRLLRPLWRADREEWTAYRETMDQALARFAEADYAGTVRALRELASRSLRRLLESPHGRELFPPSEEEPPPGVPPGRRDERIKLLLAAHPEAQRQYGFLSGLQRDARSAILHREEALLAVVAFGQLADWLNQTHHQWRHARGRRPRG